MTHGRVIIRTRRRSHASPRSIKKNLIKRNQKIIHSFAYRKATRSEDIYVKRFTSSILQISNADTLYSETHNNNVNSNVLEDAVLKYKPRIEGIVKHNQ